MDVFIEITPVFLQRARAFCKSFIKIILGSYFLTICAKVMIPIQPVPMTLQTLGIFFLAIMLGRRQAGLSGILYLVQATMGLPVLAGGSCPLWMFGPTAGYLFAMPVSAYVIGMIVERKRELSVLWLMFAIFCGQLIIYSFGMVALSYFVGFKMAFVLGVLPFLPLAALKLLLASSMNGLYLLLKKKFV